MNRFHRFASLRWVYSLIVPPRYRAKLNITEELQSVEKTLDKTIEQVNRNSEAVDGLLADGGSPAAINLSRLDPDENGKGYIVEIYPNGYTQETELTYENGEITKIKDGSGNETVLVWGTVSPTITYNAPNCTIDPMPETVDEGGRLELLAWSNEGYNLDTIQVTMGGVDISDMAVAQQGNDAQLRIENVTGDVVITITTIGG